MQNCTGKTPLIFVCSFFAGTGISSGSNGNMFGNFARWNEPNTSPRSSTPSLSMSKKEGIDIGGSSEEKEKMPSGPSNKLHIQVLDSGEYTVSIRPTHCLEIKLKISFCILKMMKRDILLTNYVFEFSRVLGLFIDF